MPEGLGPSTLFGRREREQVKNSRRLREEAEEERQAGKQGQWQLESPDREYLERVKCCSDTDCTHRMMKQGLSRPEKWRVRRIYRTKGTCGMEGCVVLFKPRIHLFACTHPSVSNTLACNDWLVHKHQSTALCSNTFGLWFLVVYKHQSPALCFKHVWIMVPCRIQTRLDYGSLSVYTHQSTALCFQTRLIVVACLFTLPPTPK